MSTRSASRSSLSESGFEADDEYEGDDYQHQAQGDWGQGSMIWYDKSLHSNMLNVSKTDIFVSKIVK